LYDIRESFKGRTDSGRLNAKSDNPRFTELDTILREKIDILAEKIEPKIFEYGFLLR